MTGTERAPAPTPPPEAVSWIEIDLDAVRRNYRTLRNIASPSARFFAVVKADAYGHGAVEVARTVMDAGADLLAVARIEEAAQLRAAGIGAPLLVLAPPFLAQAEAAAGLDAALVVCTIEQARAADAAGRAAGRAARIHLKTDVGMGRLGCRPEETVGLLREISALTSVRVEGVMTHFPWADGKTVAEADALTRKQIAAFEEVRRGVVDAGLAPEALFHAANSAAALDYPEAHFDAVRCGIALYGQQPSFETANRPPLDPAMTVRTRIVFLKEVPAGTGLSYGHTAVTTRPTKVATVPLGYADGYPRHASNRTAMMVNGSPAAVLGRVCMDHTLLDVTDVGEVGTGDEVLAFGAAGGSRLAAEDVAAAFGSIGYELTTRIGKRLPRVYRGR